MKVEILMLLTGAGCIGYAANQLRKGGGAGGAESPRQEPVLKRKQFTLAEASDIWTGKKLYLKDVYHIWKEPEKETEPKLPRPAFNHPEIDDFYTKYIEKRASIKGSRRIIIVKLLKMLDVEGDCPSVVRNSKVYDAENDYSLEDYKLLQRVPLWQHSLEVARTYMSRINQEILAPDCLIVSLAHDIGKLPVYHEKGYATGDHYTISALVLNGIPEFTNLNNRHELAKIVREHHNKKTENPLATILKECDQLTRNDEFSRLFHAQAESDRQAQSNAAIEPAEGEGGNKAATPIKDSPEAAKRKGPRGKLGKGTPGTVSTADNDDQQGLPGVIEPLTENLPRPTRSSKETDHPLGHTTELRETKEKGHKPKRVPLDWFDPDATLTELRKYINVVSENKWEAVSMLDGLVYCNPEALWRALKTVTPRNPALSAAAADDETKRNILYSVVWELAEKKGAIATDMMESQHYMTQVSVITSTGRTSLVSPLLIPFRAEPAFGVLASEFENEKSIAIRRMVKIIKPKTRESD